jgi:hypothetical protein
MVDSADLLNDRASAPRAAPSKTYVYAETSSTAPVSLINETNFRSITCRRIENNFLMLHPFKSLTSQYPRSMRPLPMGDHWRSELVSMLRFGSKIVFKATYSCIPTCIPYAIDPLQALNNMEISSLPRAPKLRKVLLSKPFFFVCSKVDAQY